MENIQEELERQLAKYRIVNPDLTKEILVLFGVIKMVCDKCGSEEMKRYTRPPSNIFKCQKCGESQTVL